MKDFIKQQVNSQLHILDNPAMEPMIEHYLDELNTIDDLISYLQFKKNEVLSQNNDKIRLQKQIELLQSQIDDIDEDLSTSEFELDAVQFIYDTIK